MTLLIFADAHPGLTAWLAVLAMWTAVETIETVAGAIARRRR